MGMRQEENGSLAEKFGEHEAEIYSYIVDRRDDYFDSSCFRNLKNRMARLDDSLDMKFNSSRTKSATRNDFRSKIAMPLVREKYRILQGMTLASFRQDPLVTILPDGDTPRVNADNSQRLLNQNWRRTEFRRRAWRPAVACASRYGAAVMVHNYRETTLSAEKTMETPFGYEKRPITRRHHNCFGHPISPLNYFQNKDIAEPEESDYQGWIDRIPLSDLIAEVRRDESTYIKKNLKMIIELVQKAAISDARYYNLGNTQSDWQRIGVDPTYWYGRINIEGYEEDPTRYYAEIIGEKIVRFSTNFNDEDIVPVSIYTYDPRLDRWWGNSPVENSMPIENFVNIILGMRADQAMKEMEKVLFFDRALGVDPSEINNRMINGGYVGVDAKGRSLGDVFFEWEPRMSAGQTVEPLLRELKEADQRLSFDQDFSRAPAQGGPQNETATAAIMMDEKGNVLKSDILEAISYGLIDTSRKHLVILQQRLPDEFAVALKPGAGQQMLEKRDVLGFFQYAMAASLTKNKITQLTNIMNFLTALQNYRGTGDPAYMAVNLPPIIRSWISKYDLDIDLDETYPPLPLAAPQGAQMGMGVPGGALPATAAAVTAPGATDMQQAGVNPQEAVAYAA